MSSAFDVSTTFATTNRPIGGKKTSLTQELLKLPVHESRDAMLQAAADAIAVHLDAAVVRIWSVESDELRLRVSVGVRPPFDGLQDHVPIAGAELGGVVRKKRPYLVDCLASSTPSDVKDWAKTSNVAGFVALPLIVEDKSWGVLALFTRRLLDEAQIDLLKEATGLLSLGIALCRARENGQEAAESLRALSLNIPSAVIALDLRGCVSRWNAAAENLFGWSLSQVEGKPVPILPDERQQEFHDEIDHVLSGHSLKKVPGVFRRADGSDFPTVRTAVPLRDATGEISGTLHIITDDSARIRSAQCLQVHARVTKVLGGAPNIEEAAPGLLAAVGEWTGAEVSELWLLDDEQSALTRAAIWATSQQLRDRLAAVNIRMAATADEFPALTLRQDQLTVSQDEKPSRFPSPLPAQKRWALPIRNHAGRFGVLAVAGVDLDRPDQRTLETLQLITDAVAQFLERKRTEAALAKTEASLRQSQKMDAIGLLAGGVAHDFNNLLTVILAYSELGLDETDQDHPLREMFVEIHSAGERAAAMTRQLLAVSRQQPPRMGPVNLNQLVADMDRMLQRLVGPQIKLMQGLEDEVSLVLADVNQMEQVLLNLVVNARDAMPNGGTITVSTRDVSLTAADVHGEEEMRAGDFVVLSVTDTGCGMDAATLSRIFEPFFTTKEAGRGTGMGLATVFGIVKQHDGFVKVQSEPNAGTTFYVFLPLCRRQLAVETFDSAPDSAPNGTEKVLIVDRDDAVRSLMRRLLEVRGYNVVEASHGGEALDYLAKPRHGIDLLIADAQLPVVDGACLVRRVQQMRRGPKTLLVSASAEPPADSVADVSRQFLTKPFTSLALARQVRAALDAPQS